MAKLVDWINAAHVAPWWDGLVDINIVKEKYGVRLGADAITRMYVIALDGKAIGFIQCYRHNSYPDYDREIGISNAAGIDYLIGEINCTGRGIGTRAISIMAEMVFAMYPEIESVVSTPQRNNQASCKALAKAGFKCIEERKLSTGDPADADVSSIYVLERA